MGLATESGLSLPVANQFDLKVFKMSQLDNRHQATIPGRETIAQSNI